MKKLKILMVAGAATMLSSCDLSQIPGLDGRLSIEDSKAVGAACRHSGRALEDCFTLNPKTHQAGVFDGWRDMNDYMLANEIDEVKPEFKHSAFSQEKVTAAGSSSPDVQATQTAPGYGAANQQAVNPVDGAAQAAQAAPAVQGRERWTPKGAAENTTAQPLESPQPATGNAETNTSTNATTNSTTPLAKEEPSTQSPARPWERKKDPKKHT